MSNPSRFDDLKNTFNKIEYTDKDLKKIHSKKLELIEVADNVALENIDNLIDNIFIKKSYKEVSITLINNELKGLNIETKSCEIHLHQDRIKEMKDFLSDILEYAKNQGLIKDYLGYKEITKREIFQERLNNLKSDDKKQLYEELRLKPQQIEEQIEMTNEKIKELEEKIKELDRAQQEEQVSTNISEATTNTVDFENKEQSNSQGIQ